MLLLLGAFAMRLGLWSVEGRMVLLMMMYSTRGEASLIGGLGKNCERRRIYCTKAMYFFIQMTCLVDVVAIFHDYLPC